MNLKRTGFTQAVFSVLSRSSLFAARLFYAILGTLLTVLIDK